MWEHRLKDSRTQESLLDLGASNDDAEEAAEVQRDPVKIRSSQPRELAQCTVRDTMSTRSSVVLVVVGVIVMRDSGWDRSDRSIHRATR